jgi:Cu(I)/Ag(I) efflux system membrane fusion protein
MSTNIPTSGPGGKPGPSVHEPPPGAAFMNLVRWVLFGGLTLLALGSIASFVAWRVQSGRPSSASAHVALYHCPMHPSYTSDKPGDCPICNMKLEPVPTSATTHTGHAGDVPGLAPVQIASTRTQLIGVRTARVTRGSLGDGSPLVGFVAPDESRLRRVQLRVAGWVKDVQVNRTGEVVTAGQPMLSIYSPELYQTEQEYLITMGAGASEPSKPSHEAGAHQSARARLKLLGVPDEELARLDREHTPSSQIALRSPVTGTVLERNVVEGQYVGADTPLMTVADLSRVWVLVDLYEMDLGRVKLGDRARFTADGLPGRTFEADIDFIYPTVSSETRTLKARLSLANPDGVLRPGMYGQVDVSSRRGASSLVVPAEAVVNTGEISYVFLARGEGHFEPRRVWTGTSDGDHVTVLKGLAEGDTVVSSASFLIDSESRLKAAIAGLSAPDTAAAPAGAAHRH